MERTGHRLQCYGVGTCSVKDEKGFSFFSQHLLNLLCSGRCPGIVAVAYRMVIVCFPNRIHHQGMHA